MITTQAQTIESQSVSRRQALEDARWTMASQDVSQDATTLPDDLADGTQLTPTTRQGVRPRGRVENAVLVAVAIGIQCPHCDASQPAPGGSEFCEPSEAREMCDDSVVPCVACDQPIRLTWHDKVQVGL